MRSIIGFLVEINTSLSLYCLISTDLIRLLQNPPVSLRIERSLHPFVRAEGCRMLGRCCQVGWQGGFLLGPAKGLRLSPCNLGHRFVGLSLIWAPGIP